MRERKTHSSLSGESVGGTIGGYSVEAITKDIEEEIRRDSKAPFVRNFAEISKIHIAPMTEEINVSFGAVLYREGLTFDSIYKIADRGGMTARQIREVRIHSLRNESVMHLLSLNLPPQYGTIFPGVLNNEYCIG